MGKGLRSKVKRRWRKLKKDYLDEIMMKPQLNQIAQKLQATVVGVQYRKQEKKNAFLNPDDPTAIFPQVKIPPMIDLRSSAIPGSGLQYSGASRKVAQQREEEQRRKQIEQMGQQVEENLRQNIQLQRKYLKKKTRTSKLKKLLVF